MPDATATPNDVAAIVSAKDSVSVKSYADAQFDSTEMSQITDLSSALAMLESKGLVAEDIASYGDGFSVIEKTTLVGQPFLILGWRFSESKEYGGNFVVIYVVTNAGKGIIVDGSSTGVAEQLASIQARWTENGVAPHPLRVDGGLVRSEYDTTVNVNGKDQKVHGVTYYIAGI